MPAQLAVKYDLETNSNFFGEGKKTIFLKWKYRNQLNVIKPKIPDSENKKKYNH